MKKLKSKYIKRISKNDFKKKKKNSLIILLDNVRSMYNVGSIFRISDAFLIKKICICGITATPKKKKNGIKKTALGAEKIVNWEYYYRTEDPINIYKKKKYKIIAAEHTNKSILLHSFIPKKKEKYLIIFGNEVDGIQQNILDYCNISIEIPQLGTKHSLNISVAAGIIIWHIVYNNYLL